MPHQNFHVTLAFLGSVPEGDIGRVEATATEVSHLVPRNPLQVTLDALEYWRKAGVLCATARQADTHSAMLADILKGRLVAAGFAPDLKPFRPHVTLARKVPHRVFAGEFPPVTWTFTKFALVDSGTEEAAPLYTVLKSIQIV